MRRSSSWSSRLTKSCRIRKPDSGTTWAKTTSLPWEAPAWAAWTLRISSRNSMRLSPVASVVATAVAASVAAMAAEATVAQAAEAAVDSTAHKASPSERVCSAGRTVLIACRRSWIMLSHCLFVCCCCICSSLPLIFRRIFLRVSCPTAHTVFSSTRSILYVNIVAYISFGLKCDGEYEDGLSSLESPGIACIMSMVRDPHAKFPYIVQDTCSIAQRSQGSECFSDAFGIQCKLERCHDIRDFQEPKETLEGFAGSSTGMLSSVLTLA